MQQEKNALILNAQIIETSLEDSLYSRDVAGLHTTLQEIHEETALRVTVIDADGTVLADTADPEQSMSNHLDREEVQQAMTESYGLAIRQSDTLHENLMYVAVPVYRNGQLIGIIARPPRSPRWNSHTTRACVSSSPPCSSPCSPRSSSPSGSRTDRSNPSAA